MGISVEWLAHLPLVRGGGVSCSNSLIKRLLVRRSASISFVLSCKVSNAPAGGRLSALPCWSCILGGLAWLLLVFRVDTISY